MSDLVENPEDRFSDNEAQITQGNVLSRKNFSEYTGQNKLSPMPFLSTGAMLKFQVFKVFYFHNIKNNGTLKLYLKLSLVMRKPAFCICENKDADQLRGNREADRREADQRLCFRYTDSKIPLLLKYEISSL